MTKHAVPPFREAAFCSCGEHGFVGLTLGMVALFSPEDIDLVGRANWSVLRGRGAVYARGFRAGKHILMHRAVCGDGTQAIDHRNHDTLDNRRPNLRPCLQSENLKNKRSRMVRDLPKGVHRSGRRFIACIMCDGQRFRFGPYSTPQEAGSAYESAARELHGEYSCVGGRN